MVAKQIADRFIPAEQDPLEDIQEFNDRDTRDDADEKLFANLEIMSNLTKKVTDKLQGFHGKLQGFHVEETRTVEEYARRWPSESNAGGTGDDKVP